MNAFIIKLDDLMLFFLDIHEKNIADCSQQNYYSWFLWIRDKAFSGLFQEREAICPIPLSLSVQYMHLLHSNLGKEGELKCMRHIKHEFKHVFTSRTVFPSQGCYSLSLK